MKKTIKLMPDYGCHALWWEELDLVGNIDPETLPLSQETIKRLDAWANAYDATLDIADPANSPGFLNDLEEDFEREGISLWQQLQKELSPAYEVLYFSFEKGKLLAHKTELMAAIELV